MLIKQHIVNALTEDIGRGDATTEALISPDAIGKAMIIARERLTVAGIAVAIAVFSELDNEASIETHFDDGEEIRSKEPIITVSAKLRSLLSGERTALNYLQRLSGIATISACYAEAVSGTGVLILDTRKTTPGWRVLEKYAVQCGGARNHRRGLYDMMLIKDNHLAALPGKNRVAEAVSRARRASPEMKIEVEADTLEQAKQAAEAGADIVLLDNMTILYGGGLSNSTVHSGTNLPILLVGGGAGWLKGGEHRHYPNEPTMADLLLSLMQKFDFHVDKLGGSSGPISI